MHLSPFGPKCPKKDGAIREMGKIKMGVWYKVLCNDEHVISFTPLNKIKETMLKDNYDARRQGIYVWAKARYAGKFFKKKIYLADCGVIPYSDGKWHQRFYTKVFLERIK